MGEDRVTFEELNKLVTDNVKVDWTTWRGSIFQEGCAFLSDKSLMFRKSCADPAMFKWLEELDFVDPYPDFRKHDCEVAETSWDQTVSRYYVDALTPVDFLELGDDFVFPYLVVLKNTYRQDQFIFVDARKYRLFLETADIDKLFGKELRDPIIAEADYGDEQEITGFLAPMYDQSGKYTKKVNELING